MTRVILGLLAFTLAYVLEIVGSALQTFGG